MIELKNKKSVSSPESASSVEFHFKENPPEDWDHFVSQHTGCFFHKSLWHKILKQGYRTKGFYASLSKEGHTVAGIYGEVFDFKIFRMFFSTVPYGGFVGDKKYMAALMPLLEQSLKAKGVHQIRLTRVKEYSYPDLPDYHIRQAYQHQMELKGKDLDQIWKEYRKNTRRDINRAKKTGVTIREIQDQKELGSYIALYQKTMHRNHALCHYTRTLYETIYEELVKSGKATVLFAELEGKKIGGVLLIFSADRTYLLGSVSDPAYLKYCPNDLLYQAAIEKTLEKSLNYFDLMMSEEQDARLMFFKEKWGAKAHAFTIFQKDLNPFRTWIWNGLWHMANSPAGAWLIRQLREPS